MDLPYGQNLQPQIGTDWSTTGQIYWYTLRSTNLRYDLMELRSLEDWVLLKQFKSVPNVVDVSDFGGTVREYQVRVDPNKLVSYGLSIGQAEQQLANNNINAGGSFVEVGLQQMNVRALGLFNTVRDIEQTVLTAKTGTPLRVKDIAYVVQGPKMRLGHLARANHMEDGRIIDEPDVIQGGVLMRKGAEEELTDVKDAFVAVESNGRVSQIYTSGARNDAKLSRDISEYSYRRGALALLDFLVAQRNYDAIELSYRQAVAAYLTAIEQLRQAVGSRDLL